MTTRIDTPYGRFYQHSSGAIAPSVTTVLEQTQSAKEAMGLIRWRKRVKDQGLKEEEAMRYCQALIDAGSDPDWAYSFAMNRVGRELSQHEANAYLTWRSCSSSDRGTALHKALEDGLPLYLQGGKRQPFRSYVKKEQTDTTMLLIQSLEQGGVINGFTKIHRIEEKLWYSSSTHGSFAGTIDIDADADFGHGITAYAQDWKTKDPKHYCPTQYSHKNKLQLVAYAGALLPRFCRRIEGLAVNYCFTDGSPAVQALAHGNELNELWDEWTMKLRVWWGTIAPDCEILRNAPNYRTNHQS